MVQEVVAVLKDVCSTVQMQQHKRAVVGATNPVVNDRAV